MAKSGPVSVRVEGRIDRVARRMLDAILEEVPLYSHLPREQLDGEVLDICRSNLRVFFRSLREGRPPEGEDLAEMRASAARRAEERVPLGAVLTAYHVGGRVGWDELCAEATPAEHEEVLGLAAGVIAYLRAVTSVVAGAYLEEQQAIYGEQREAQRALVESLLSGEPAEPLASRAGVTLAPGYVVVALALGPSVDEKDAGVSATVAGRRKVRRVEQTVSVVCADGALCQLLPAGGEILLPVPGPDVDAVLADAVALVGELAAAAGADVRAGVSWRPGVGGVRDAANESHEVLRLAASLGRPPGAYRLDDVLLEYTISRPSAARDRLEALLEPLEDGPDLLATLEGWFDADFDRRRAAAALHVHPNTLDYRLRRVAELTGLDLGTAVGLQLLGAALTAKRVGRGESL